VTTKSPAFQFYPDDFLGSGKVGTMTTDEVGAYTLLLCLEWNETGFVYDEEELARWCRLSRAKFRKAWTRVSRCFVERDGRLFNPRLDAEREKQAIWREKSRKGGLTSGQHRSKPNVNGGSTVVQPPLEPNGNGGSTTGATKDEPKGNTPFPSPTPVTALPTKTTTSRRKNVGGETAEAANGTRDRTTWLSPICTVWEQQFGGGSFATVAGQAARVIRPLLQGDTDTPEVAKRLAIYLSKTDPQFASVAKFAQTFGEWTPKRVVDDNGVLTSVGVRAWHER
jgi:uncharacterized protein YdaU (DUF1376 family)